MQLFPQLFALMFTSDSELVSYASWALRIYMAATGIFGIQIACQQTFVALGNAKISLFLAVLRKIILLIPFIYILPNFLRIRLLRSFWRSRWRISWRCVPQPPCSLSISKRA